MKMSKQDRAELLQAALEAVSKGVSIIPVGFDKRPILSAWAQYQEALPTEAELREWSAKEDLGGFAVITGKVSGGLIQLDFDVEGFIERFSSAIEERDAELYELIHTLPLQRTGGGGYQISFRMAEPVRNLKLAYATNEEEKTGREVAIETRGEGGYALIPPSFHPSGGRYQAIRGSVGDAPLLTDDQAHLILSVAGELNDAPFTLQELERLRKREQAREVSHDPEGSAARLYAAYNAANPIQTVLRRYGYTEESRGRWTRPHAAGEVVSGNDVNLWTNGRGIMCSCHHSSNDLVNQLEGELPMEPFDLFRIHEHNGDAKAAMRAAALELGGEFLGKKKDPKTNGIKPKAERRSAAPTAAVREVSQAEELISQEKPSISDMAEGFLLHQEERGVRYAYLEKWDSWYVYEHGVYVEYPERTVRRHLDAVLQGYGQRGITETTLGHVIKKVQRAERVHRDGFDLGPYELNVRNGILNLRTGEFRDHSPDFFSITQSGAAFDPDATAPVWEEFLLQAVPEDAMRTVLQEFAGYMLTEETGAQKALILIGEGGTGKGTFISALQELLGGDHGHSLAGAVDMEDIKDGTPKMGLLLGKRVTVVSEIGKRVNWNSFKRITGEDVVQINPKYKDAFNVRLSTKIVILSNIAPHLGDDTGNTSLTRRFLPVPFNQKPVKQDPRLREKLRQELPGVLNWAREGLARLLEAELQFSNDGSQALRREIIENSNKALLFLEECCVVSPGSTDTTSAGLYAHYQEWSLRNGYHASSNIKFTRECEAAMKVLGGSWEMVRKDKDRTGAFWINLKFTSLPG